MSRKKCFFAENNSVRLKKTLAMLSSVPDFRVRGRTKHPLATVLTIAAMSIAAGGEGARDMEDFGLRHLEELRTFLPMSYGVPSHDTFTRVLSKLDPRVLDATVTLWLEHGGINLEGKVISFDGKASRRTGTDDRPCSHTVSAWADDLNLVISHENVAEKSNEITAMPKIVKRLGSKILKGAIVTADAMGCQREIARAIDDVGAYWLLALKGNQETMFNEVKLFMDDLSKATDRKFEDSVTLTKHHTVEKDHGRIEERTCWVSADTEWFQDKAKWPGLCRFVMVNSKRMVKGVTSEERRYYISSFHGDAESLGRYVRKHWGIENRLHWVLDVVFGEDYSRGRTGNLAENLTALRHLALALLRRNGEGDLGPKRMRKNCAWDFKLLKRVFTGE